jgi:hypothetical protein
MNPVAPIGLAVPGTRATIERKTGVAPPGETRSPSREWVGGE